MRDFFSDLKTTNVHNLHAAVGVCKVFLPEITHSFQSEIFRNERKKTHVYVVGRRLSFMFYWRQQKFIAGSFHLFLSCLFISTGSIKCWICTKNSMAFLLLSIRSISVLNVPADVPRSFDSIQLHIIAWCSVHQGKVEFWAFVDEKEELCCWGKMKLCETWESLM